MTKRRSTILGAWSTVLYTYIFHRHISDGSFHIEKEYKSSLLPGLFNDEVVKDAGILAGKIDEIIHKAVANLPSGAFRLRLRPQDCHSQECQRPPMVVKVSNEALSLDQKRVSFVLQQLSRQLDTNSSLYFVPEKSLGALHQLADETALQWFSISLLSHSFIDWKTSKSIILLNVSEDSLFLTTAVPPNLALPEERLLHVRHLHAFGHAIKIATFKYPELGLYSARSHVFGLSSTPTVFSSRDGTSGIDVRSACVNPVCDAFWTWRNSTYHVRGVVNGTYELVRERNGPFAGKKINRPVAKYDYCHRVCASFVNEKLRVKFESQDGGKADKAIFDSLRGSGRKVFMAGLLREKCIERGLTLPGSGNDIPNFFLPNSAQMML